jgi:hypothetical protein
MCFNKFLFKEYSIANEDKLCFKIMTKKNGNTLESYIYGFLYEIGKTYVDDSVPIDVLNSKNSLEGGVFHSYSQIQFQDLYGIWVDNNMRRLPFLYVVECSIPKGARYWFNPEDHTFASSKIRIDKVVDLDKLMRDAIGKELNNKD